MADSSSTPRVTRRENGSLAIDNPSHEANCGKWSMVEDEALRAGVRALGPKSWKLISSEYMSGLRTDVQCLHRWQKVLRPGLVKGPWTSEEDAVILECKEGGISRWSEIAARIPGRIGKQCRERWFNHLDPSVSKEPWSLEEDNRLTALVEANGPRWKLVSESMTGRSENAVKNRWNSAQRRRRVAKAAETEAAKPKPAKRPRPGDWAEPGSRPAPEAATDPSPRMPPGPPSLAAPARPAHAGHAAPIVPFVGLSRGGFEADSKLSERSRAQAFEDSPPSQVKALQAPPSPARAAAAGAWAAAGRDALAPPQPLPRAAAPARLAPPGTGASGDAAPPSAWTDRIAERHAMHAAHRGSTGVRGSMAAGALNDSSLPLHAVQQTGAAAQPHGSPPRPPNVPVFPISAAQRHGEQSWRPADWHQWAGDGRVSDFRRLPRPFASPPHSQQAPHNGSSVAAMYASPGLGPQRPHRAFASAPVALPETARFMAGQHAQGTGPAQAWASGQARQQSFLPGVGPGGGNASAGAATSSIGFPPPAGGPYGSWTTDAAIRPSQAGRDAAYGWASRPPTAWPPSSGAQQWLMTPAGPRLFSVPTEPAPRPMYAPPAPFHGHYEARALSEMPGEHASPGFGPVPSCGPAYGSSVGPMHATAHPQGAAGPDRPRERERDLVASQQPTSAARTEFVHPSRYPGGGNV